MLVFYPEVMVEHASEESAIFDKLGFLNFLFEQTGAVAGVEENGDFGIIVNGVTR